MAKKPPGAKKRGPTAAKPRDEWGQDPKSAMHRMMNARPVVTCSPDALDEVLWAAKEYLGEGEFDPPLPKFSLFAGEDEQGNALLSVYGLPFDYRSFLRMHLERHPKAQEWDVTDATTDWQGKPT